ncbi:LysE/ArgO family amino acid transporter [Haliangium ochraceum]|uniref:Lysine exporter protein (LYSE/YGGA) n=1 Tax=Haliangium ochraceum (strain DSM 14365 / JCM 11303 / SMP-2) TaxID=502025 RepID=D0LGC7_HALO1|nr:LysE family transporter [Haliangium ochraceum]ACY18152.1 Lysine exporter protein (LYSE/YGGA) [Haliangium ochraceum DSM 14365]
MLTYFLMGIAVGVISGMPIGPVNLAVIDSTFRYNLRRGLAVGAGGALGDGLYALLGILLMGPIFDRYPILTPLLYALSGVLLFLYSVRVIRSAPAVPVGRPEHTTSAPRHKSLSTAFLVGVALVLMNPAAIVTWVIIVGWFMQDATIGNGAVAALGVCLGSLAWFSSIANLAERKRHIIGEKILLITRIIAYLILAASIVAMGRAVYEFAAY